MTNTPAAGRTHERDCIDILWGAKAIARYLGTSMDVVYALRSEPNGPVRKYRGKLFAFKADLLAYLQANESERP